MGRHRDRSGAGRGAGRPPAGTGRTPDLARREETLSSLENLWRLPERPGTRSPARRAWDHWWHGWERWNWTSFTWVFGDGSLAWACPKGSRFLVPGSTPHWSRPRPTPACVSWTVHAAPGESREGTRQVRLTRQGQSIDVTACVVLLATGLAGPNPGHGSAVRTRIRSGSRIGAGCVIVDAPRFYDERTIFMAVGRDGYVGAVRVEDGSLNVAAAFAPGLVRRSGSPAQATAAVLAEAGFPAIAGLDKARWRGTTGLTRRTRPLAEERLFLLGDAAGYVEPFTGEGIAWAMASGQAVTPLALRAMDRWDPLLAVAWSDLHRRLIGRRQIVCRAVALGLRQPWLAAIGFEILSRHPAAASIVVRRLNALPFFTNASGPCPS